MKAAWLAALCALAGAATPAARAAELPSFAEVQARHRPSDLLLRDRSGEPLQTLRIDATVRRLPWLPLAQFSPALRELIVAGEDRQFWQHAGIDWPATARSALAGATQAVAGGSGPTPGASTLSMQLAALVDVRLARPAGGRDVWRKAGQMAAAKGLEAGWRKEQILEAYLNLVPLRGELVGMPAAAQRLFGKHASGLDRAEAALLVALVRAPNAATPAVARRSCQLLALKPDCERGAALAAAALQRPPAALGPALAPHFARWHLQQRPAAVGEAQRRSTLDAALQRSATQLLRTQMAELQGRQVEDGAVVVLDNASGEVRAWVGSSGAAWSDAPQVDAVLARRQPGSTLKPFVYGLAFEQGVLTPASLLLDAPAELDGGSGAFMPRNYDHHYRGWVSARSALAGSLNVPTARLAALLGPQPLFELLNRSGLQLARDGGFHGLALALGSAEVTLLQLTNAYRMLANGGRWSPVAGLPGAPRRVLDEATAFQLADILADGSARAASFGLDSALVTRGFAAVKTGTSKDMRDNWCIGFTDRYTVGVWVGNAGGEAMHRVSGTQGAAPVWRALVQQLHAGAPSRAPRPPAGVRLQAVRFDRGLEPARDEWLRSGAGMALAGAQGRSQDRSERLPLQAGPPVHRVQGGEQLARRPLGIEQPRNGAVFALDPDMPAPVQRLRFAGEAGQWWLDGRLLGSGAQLSWAPWPGRHRLQLKADDGRLLGEARFEVRGATLRSAAAR